MCHGIPVPSIMEVAWDRGYQLAPAICRELKLGIFLLTQTGEYMTKVPCTRGTGEKKKKNGPSLGSGKRVLCTVYR